MFSSLAAMLVLQVLRKDVVVWHHPGAQLASKLPCSCNMDTLGVSTTA